MDSIRSSKQRFLYAEQKIPISYYPYQHLYIYSLTLFAYALVALLCPTYMVMVLRRGLTNKIDDATPTGMLACKPETGAHYR